MKRKLHRTSRPCAFCSKFHTNLSRHILTEQQNEPEVKELLKLDRSENNTALALLRKRYEVNKDKSTNGRLSSHGGTVKIDEVKMSFCLKPIVDKSVLTRRPSGRIWFGRLSKSFVNRSSKAQFRAGLLSI